MTLFAFHKLNRTNPIPVRPPLPKSSKNNHHADQEFCRTNGFTVETITREDNGGTEKDGFVIYGL